jgi:hypothetical protein
MSFYTGGTEVHIDPSRSGGVHGTRLLLLALFLTGAVAFLGIGYLIGMDDSPAIVTQSSPDGGSDEALRQLVSALQTPQAVVMIEATKTETPIPSPTITPSPKPPAPPTCVTPVPGEKCMTMAATMPPIPPPAACSEVFLTPSLPCVWPTPDPGRYEQP